MAHLKLKGFVIRVVAVGESDRIVTILTEEYGLISVSVRGARRTRSPHLLTTQIFSFSDFELFCSKNRYSLQSSELIEPFMALQQDLDRLVCASHFAEVMVDSLRDDLAQPRLYRLWAYSMQALSRREDPLLTVHVAQLRLLMEIGFAPSLDHCISCGCPLADPLSASSLFSVTGGGLVCDKPACRERLNDARPLPAGSIACLVHIRQADWQNLFAFTLEENLRRFIIELSGAYLTHQMEKAYTRLDMLRSIAAAENEPQEN